MCWLPDCAALHFGVPFAAGKIGITIRPALSFPCPLIAQSLELEIIIQDEVSNYRPHPFNFFRRWHFPDLLRAAARVGNRMYGDCYGAVSLVAGAPFRRDELAAQFVSERHHSLPCPGVPFAGGKIGITFTFLPPHFEQTKCRCLGTSTKIISFQSFSSSNVFTA